MSALTPIDQVIRQLCRDTGEPDYKNYDTILSHVRGAIVDLNLYVIPSVKTATLKADHLGNLEWPCDCVKPILVGIIRNNKVCTLSVDSGIAKQGDCGCANISEVESHINNITAGKENGTDVYFYDGHEVKGYGSGYDKLDVCVHDKDRRLTHVKTRILKSDKFQLTYVSDGISDGVTHVPVETETAIGEWVFWKYYRRSSVGLSDRGRERYKEEFTRLRKFYNDETLDDWIRAIVRK